MKKILFGIALALALPSLVLAYFQPATLTDGVSKVAVYTKAQADKYFGDGFYLAEKADLGAAAGTEHSNLEYFHGGLVQGGGLFTFTATATQAAYTMTAATVKNFSQFDSAALNGVAVSITLPATNTLTSILPKIGDKKELYYRNLNTTSASTTTFVAGAGIDLRMGEETGADVIINGLNNAVLTFRRVSALVISVIVNEDVVGD